MKKVKIYDAECSRFADKQAYNNETRRYEYLSPMTITYQIADADGEFAEIPDPKGYQVVPGGRDWGQEKFNEFIDDLPFWEGDLADIIAYYFELGWYTDYCETVQGGLVFLGAEADGLEGSKTQKGQTVWSFKEAFDEMSIEDLQAFVEQKIN